MNFFDFHHHTPQKSHGIYNLRPGETVPVGWFSAGIHPEDIGDTTEDHFDWLMDVIQNPQCVAIGECGLDGRIATAEKTQAAVFLRQIEIANKIRKPLIIHCVKRHAALLPFKKIAQTPMIIHGFNNRKTIGEEMLRHDFYLSFGKSVLHNVNLQQFVKDFPTERLFLETDSADFDLGDLYGKVSQLKGMSLDALTEILAKNFENIRKTSE